MMGSTVDPADGKAVAGTVFSAVIVYAVCTAWHHILKACEGNVIMRSNEDGWGTLIADLNPSRFSSLVAVSKPTFISENTEEVRYRYHNNRIDGDSKYVRDWGDVVMSKVDTIIESQQRLGCIQRVADRKAGGIWNGVRCNIIR
jgi:hypothetical protein